MKNITRILGLLLLVGTLSTTSGFSQGKSEEKAKANKENVKKAKNDINNKMDSIVESNKNKEKSQLNEKSKKEKDFKDDDNRLRPEKDVKNEKPNNAKAYGRNKDDMSGKEFGKLRASEAKEKIDDTKDNLNENEEVLRRGREKVKEAKEKVLKERTEKGVDEEIIRQKEENIKKAEEKLNALEEVIKRGKERVIKKAQEIEEVQKSN